MIRRLAPLCFIFLCTSVSWFVLGTTIDNRTQSSTERLRGRVQSVWGEPQKQMAPSAEFEVPVAYTETVEEDGKKKTVEKTKFETHFIRPRSSEVAADLQLEHRKKGLLWYSTYKVGFQGEYEFRNTEQVSRKVRLTLYLPGQQAIYDDLRFLVNGDQVPVTVRGGVAYSEFDLLPDQDVKMLAGYRSQGLDSWRYNFGKDISQVNDFHLRMSTNFKNIDFPDNTLAPSEKRETPGGWQLDWTYKNLLSGYEIALAMPEKIQPGPLASEISFFAPVSLFFFFFLIFMITTLRGMELHPMNYFFLACAFFAFHLLLAYLVDHIDLYLSFAISAVVSVLLVVSYLRIVVGSQFALREAAAAQMIYLILFSVAFFFRRFTGLAITIGSILTLFSVMQMTARIKWSERFAGVLPAGIVPPPLPRVSEELQG